MNGILVIYASKHGHTAKIARRIAAQIEQAGVSADLRAVASASDVSPAEYDAVVLGGSIHAGHHRRDLVDWARSHATALSLVPSAFFSVCLTAADDTDEAREATRSYLDDFVETTGWTPSVATTFAGALQYREYDFATRLVMRLLMRRGGHPTDVHHDHDYTDWDAVDRFAADCAATAAQPALTT